MKLLTLARSTTLDRGYRYFSQGIVIESEKIDENHYIGKVAGSYEQSYAVELDLEKPYNSNCECAFAQSGRVICKHMVALYLQVDSDALKWLINEWKQDEINKKMEYEEQVREINVYVESLTIEELKERLLNILLDEIDYSEEYDDRHYW